MSGEWINMKRFCERCSGEIVPSKRDRTSRYKWESRRFCGKSCAARKEPVECPVDGCHRVTFAYGMCNMHYRRFKTTGSTDSPKRLTTPEKLREYSAQVGDCIEYRGWCNHYGYGVIYEWRKNKRKRITAHRAAVILSGRILGPDDVVMHTCDNPPCINPEHLVVGTQGQNVEDARNKGRLDDRGLLIGQHGSQYLGYSWANVLLARDERGLVREDRLALERGLRA